MPQIFSPAGDTKTRSMLLAAVIAPFLFVALAYALVRSSYVTGQDKVVTQPVPFSHAHHAGQLGIDCRYCHTGVEKAAFVGLPPTETCMTCHSQIWTNASMLAPVRESFVSDKPVSWRRVHVLPDYVYFDHSIHIAKGVGCTTCHGAVDRMPLMLQHAPLTMGWCLDCHRNPSGNLRPQAEVFALNWAPPPDQVKRGHELLAQYGIATDHLTDCSVCHR